MASGFLNMLSYWMFFTSSVIMVISLFVEAGPAAAGWTIYPPLSALPMAHTRIWNGNDALVGFNGHFYCIIFIRFLELYCDGDQS